ncbi:MAG: flavin reductase family protein [Pyrinomonadaceae bacterium]
MPVTNEEFRAALSRFPSGVTVVTTRDDKGRFHGITVSAFCSLSLEPPRVLICIEKTTGSHGALHESQAFVVNMLSAEQREVSERFASTVENKFAGIDLETGLDRIPVLLGCVATLECRVTNTYDGGDHSIFVGEVERATVRDGDPILYFRGDYRAISA